MYEVLRRNLGYKIVSLVLALLFWLWVTNQGSNQTLSGDQVLTVPLLTKNLPANSMVMTTLPPVKVRLQGTNPNVNVKDLYAYVDLSGSTPGEHQFDIRMDPIPGIRIVELMPNKVTLRIDTVQEKMLPVQLNLTGNPAEGREVGTPIIRPSAVNVRGPGSVLASLDKVVVDVNLAGASESIRDSRPILFRDKMGKAIFAPDPSVETLTAYPNSVDVIVPITAKGLVRKEIPLKVTSKGTPATGLVVRSLLPVPDRVTVLGSPEALKGFDSLILGPVDVSGLSEDKVFQIPPEKVSLPAGISFAAGTTFTVVAKIGLAAQQKSIANVPVQVRNLPPEMELEQGITPVNVTVQGLPEVLNGLTAGQISLWVDVGGQAPGKYNDVKVFWQLPAGVEMVSVPTVSYSLKAKQ